MSTEQNSCPPPNLDQQPEHGPIRPGSRLPAGPMQDVGGLWPDVSRNIRPEDLPCVTAVEAALLRKPSPGSRSVAAFLCVMFLVALGWARWAEMDEVTRADGQVVPSRRTQIIQNLEGGILGGVLVREGQIVEKDTPLAQLENKLAESQYRDAVHRIRENELAILRLEAELIETPPVFTPAMEQDMPQLVQDQRALYLARERQWQSEAKLLESQYTQRRREVEELRNRKQQTEQNLQLVRERKAIAYPLMVRKIFPRVEYLEIEQQLNSLQGEVVSLESHIPRAEAAEEEAGQRMAFRKAEQHADINTEIGKRRIELGSLRETLSAGGDRVTRTELRSPVRGTVKQIIISTVGGVVKPGEAIMEIVPLDDTLLIEARVRPADVAFLHAGQPAMVKISAYDFAIYGGLEATLEQISADTIEDKRGEFHYLVKVRTKKNSIVRNNKHLPIIPGMITTVDILTGKKTVLDYILKPIMKARQEALRER